MITLLLACAGIYAALGLPGLLYFTIARWTAPIYGPDEQPIDGTGGAR